MNTDRPQAAQLPKGLRYSLGVLSFIAYPFLLVGLIGGMLMALLSSTIDSVTEYGVFSLWFGGGVLSFAIGRGLLLAADLIRRNHTEHLSENLALKYALLVAKEVFFIVSFVHCCGFTIQVICAFMGLSLDLLTVSLILLLPGLIAGYLCHRIALHPC